MNACKLTGRWVNTNPETQGLAEIVIEQDGEGFSVSAVGLGATGPIDWPVTQRECGRIWRKKQGSARLLWRLLSTLAS